MSIVGFYDLKKKKTIWIGSSEVGGHFFLKNIHAEEIALKKIKKYLIKNKFRYSYNKNIYIYIFKYKFDGIKDVYCCKWCIGLMKKYNFPLSNIITKTTDDKFVCAINYDYEYIEPLKK